MLDFKKGESYSSEWHKVEEFTNKGLPKSALQVVEKIYSQALKDNNHAQLVKSIAQRTQLKASFEEDPAVSMITSLQQEMSASQYPVTPVLQSMLAQAYWQYYQTNRWTILDRTRVSGDPGSDIQAWDAQKFVEKSIALYRQSLQDSDKLQRTELGFYDDILQKGQGSRQFRPTLYDFLAHRALEFFRNDETGLTRPAYQFRIEGKTPFATAVEFSRSDFTTRDSLSLQYYALTLLQDLVAFHLNDKQPDALVDVDLIRLNFVRDNATSERRDSLYVQALRDMRMKFHDHPVSAWPAYELARYYHQQGNQYTPGQDAHKDDRRRADRICQEAIDRFPESDGAKNCEALQAQLRQKSLAIDVERVNTPDSPFLASISYQNVKKVYLRLIAVSPEDEEKFRAGKKGNFSLEEQLDYYRGRPFAREWTVDLPDDGDLNPHRVEIKMLSLPMGRYIILAGTDSRFSRKNDAVAIAKTWISNLGMVHKRNDKDQTVYFVFERTTGTPLKDASLTLWKQEYDRQSRRTTVKRSKTEKTGADGRVILSPDPSGRGRFQTEIRYGEDRLMLSEFINIRGGYHRHDDRTISKTEFFTDRAIYRPGQTLYFKAILLSGNSTEHKVRKEAKTTVRLYDVNGQEVSSLDLVTNDYGTVNGSFTLPSSGLTGQMRIENGEGQTSFSVEEYKRPRFEVTFEPVTGSYKLEEDVTVEGKAVSYAGANLDGADVQYRIVRKARFPYYWGFWKRPWLPASSEVEIANGQKQTDKNGRFSLTFKALADLTIPAEQKPVFNYEVQADVIDINGETHSATTNVQVGYVALSVDINVPESINRREAPDLAITTNNLNGQFEAASGKISVFRLKAPDRIFRPRLWQDPDRHVLEKEQFYQTFPHAPYADEDDFRNWELGADVQKSNFNTAEEKSCKLKNIGKWEEGRYCLQLEAKDKYGNDLKVVRFFSLFDLKTDLIPDNALTWNSVVKDAGEPGEKAVFIWGSAADNVHAWLEVYHRNTVIDERWIKVDAGKNRLEIPIVEAYRGNFSYSLFFVKHGRVLQQSDVITVPWSNKQLSITYQTFRDKLKPGQQEEWRLKIAGPDGDRIAAEMVAAMYDASLDAFVNHNWNFAVYPTFGLPGYISGLRDKSAFQSGTYRAAGDGWNKHRNFVTRQYDALDWYPVSSQQMFLRGGRTMNLGRVQEAMPTPTMEAADGFAGDVAQPRAKLALEAVTIEGESSYDQTEPDAGAAKSLQSAGPAVRSNLNETAFFFPDLQTNEKGEVLLKFTMPEALTRWKLLGFAHTPDVKFGLTEQEVITQKELMVVPNAPRFLREGDKIVMTAKVVNLSEKALSGTATLQLFDAVTMKAVDDQLGNKKAQVDFKAGAGESASLSWKLQIPEGVQAVTYRVLASAGSFSDGEENAMPVLTNRMLVTESLPLPIRGEETKTFTFDKLVNSGQSKTLRNHNLTLEFTSNPAWYAVQALPYLMEYPYECSEQVFSRFYANSLAAHIANSNPRIKRVFEQWKNTDALLSNLEKNQELKSLLLEETPWLRDAQSESERKKRIGLLFDLNRMARELTVAVRKLQQMQNPSGAWPWFPEMRDNRYITQHIVTGMGHLKNLGVEDVLEDNSVAAMLANAIRYLDEEMAEDYRKLLERKARMDEDHLGQTTIQYLYARSYFRQIPVNDQHRIAFDFWKSQAIKHWVPKNKYLQGMIGLALHRYQEKTVPAAIIRSLKEHAIHNEEFGMYWRGDNGYFWYQAPIERQALFIELFEEVAQDREAVEDMKVWLLKQKQTQDWKTTKATVEACYALLLRGTDQLASDALVQVSLGGKVVDIARRDDAAVEAGTGYFKTSWKGGDIQPDMGNVSVTKSDEGVAWGALYWQYFEQLDKITPHETPLSLRKEVFLQQNTDRGPVLQRLNEKVRLKPGDLLQVRIELRVDRAMEYVHMKDMRAAGLEPLNVLSQYQYQGGLGYYQSTRDASTNFFFGWLPKGTFVFEYPLRVTHEGDFSNGITTIQCMYAPEFTSHSEGIRLSVDSR